MSNDPSILTAQETLEQMFGEFPFTAQHVRKEGEHELFAQGYALGTGLYEGVVGAHGHEGLSLGHGSVQPSKLPGSDLLPDHGVQKLKILQGGAGGMKEGIDELERGHGAE